MSAYTCCHSGWCGSKKLNAKCKMARFFWEILQNQETDVSRHMNCNYSAKFQQYYDSHGMTSRFLFLVSQIAEQHIPDCPFRLRDSSSPPRSRSSSVSIWVILLRIQVKVSGSFCSEFRSRYLGHSEPCIVECHVVPVVAALNTGSGFRSWWQPSWKPCCSKAILFEYIAKENLSLISQRGICP